MKEAIVLAGGLGTRLRSVVADLPKCMAPVAGKPFISYVIDYFRLHGTTSFILSLGYRHEAIQSYITDQYPHMDIRYSIENEPLGTGGAIRLACKQAKESSLLVLNGDTFFRVDPRELAVFHGQQQAHCSLALKPMKNFDRYGVVVLNADQSIQSFQEKKYYDEGLINGGVYALQTDAFLSEDLPEKFSFEKDYLEKCYATRPIFGLVQTGYFIDIGVPEDYQRAQSELPKNI
ncbi:MAG TPA: nucleotidyltransferase family protein [Puia sp.]|nr:nucleotidyltransferase family protein [Puia sp.]